MTDLLRLENVVKTFAQRRGGKHAIRAVDDVSLTVKRGETVGLVGESGCGKSTLARIALRLIEPTSGRVYFDGADMTGLPARQMLPVRRKMQAVFQDPLASLNARMSILEIMREPFETHGLRPAEGEAERIHELLSFVGLRGTDLHKRPAEFSGGQLQRIAIARALAVDPEIIVADEPTSSLDPSIQAQITNLMLRIQRERRISYLIISHDLDAVGHIADWIAVMYLGAIVEYGPAPQVMGQPLHPYTQALLSAAPTLKARRDPAWQRILLGGDLPNPADTPSGCRFQSRCALVRAECQRDAPVLGCVESTERWVACHYAPDETEARGIAVANARLGHKAGGETEARAPGQTSEA